ncbi:hypothetical protein QTP88_015305 [Uroleucon formosanum]
MPKGGDCIKFKAKKNTVRHPFVIYADFKAILVKTDEKRGDSTTIIHRHEPMSYGFLVKASEDVPTELLTQHEIPAGPVIYRGDENRTDVARHFVETIVEVARKIEGNNLYGWAMSQYMPYGGFDWIEPTLNGLNDLNDTSPIGRVYEVEVTYPQHLHDCHNDLPFLPQNSVPRGLKIYWYTIYKLTEEKEVVSHFKEYFNQLLNQPVVEEGNETIYYHTAEPMIEKPEREEIDNIINKLKNNRAPGENNIVAELLKKGGTEIRREIMEMISSIWDKETLPEDWNTAVICPILKKGDPTKTKNYRGICLLDTCYKVYTSLILERINPYVNEIVGEYQSGFRKGKSTLDHIFTLRQIMAKFYEFDKELHLIFIDYKQAYDSINRDKLWEALEVLGIPKKYVSLIKGCNNRTVCRVRFLQEMSETFEVKSGLRQGDALSPTLFNLALEKAMREVWDGRKMEICGERVILAYADDIVVMGETRYEVMNTASKLLKASKTIGLRVNEEKTKHLMVARRSPNTDHITVDDYSFKKVEVFKYLGVNINSNNDMHEEINDRIACGNRCYYSIMRLLKSKLLSRNSKTLLYHSYLRPIITYASETWSLTKGDSKRLMTFERKVLRNIYGPKFDAESLTYERRNNQELQELYNRPNIIAYIRSKRLEWFGHVWRADGQVIKEVLINTINKKRPLGRPRTRWVYVIAQDIKNIEEASSFDDAYDREKWRGFVMAAMALNGPIS